MQNEAFNAVLLQTHEDRKARQVNLLARRLMQAVSDHFASKDCQL
jgi:hypothetical protein